MLRRWPLHDSADSITEFRLTEQAALVGEVMPPEPLTRRTFKTLEALADFIVTFKIVRGGFAYGDYPEVGTCYLLEYPTRQE